MITPLFSALIGLMVALGLIVCSLPIGVGLGLGGTVGIFLCEGSQGLLGLGEIAFSHLYSYSLLAMPLFVFLGTILTRQGFGNDLYEAVYKLVGRMSGSLAITSALAGAIFGFMSGSSAAGCAVVGGMSLPEMEKRGYNRRFAAGSVAVIGGLAALIPPSIIMIVYCTLTETSIGMTFVAGIIPGLVLTGFICLFIYARVKLNPQLAPWLGESFPWKERLKCVQKLLPVGVIFMGTIGSLYAGLCSAVEAGAVASAVAILLSIAYRRFSFSKMFEACMDTVRISVMIYIIVIGGCTLAHLFFISGVSHMIEEFTLGLALPPWGVILVMGAVLMALGMFLDVIAMLLVTVPIFFPIVSALGYDPVWFGVFMVVSSEMALITPPVGVNLFVIHGCAPRGTTFEDVAIGAAPYVFLLWILVGLLVAFPDLALFLPSTMKG
jgi:C4-dicarboxylate transporter DctM subunit